MTVKGLTSSPEHPSCFARGGGGADSQYTCKTPGSSQQLKLADGCHGPKSAASGAAVENAAETT